MSRQVDIISTTTGSHYLLFGLDSDSLSSFYLQLWITKTGVRMTDFVQAMGMNFCSFMNSDIWVHNDETVARCNLYGEQRDCIIGIVSNKDPLKIKVYDSLELHTDQEWEVMEITIPASLNYPDGQYSKIPKQRFKKRQGTLRAEFLRNMKTKSATASVINALSGEVLQGHSIYLKMRNTSTSQVRLFKAMINATKTRI